MIQKQESIARASVRALLHYHNYDYICFHYLQRIVAAVCIRQDPPIYILHVAKNTVFNKCMTLYCIRHVYMQ